MYDHTKKYVQKWAAGLCDQNWDICYNRLLASDLTSSDFAGWSYLL